MGIFDCVIDRRMIKPHRFFKPCEVCVPPGLHGNVPGSPAAKPTAYTPGTAGSEMATWLKTTVAVVVCLCGSSAPLAHQQKVNESVKMERLNDVVGGSLAAKPTAQAPTTA